VEYHEFLAYLFDFPQTRDLAQVLAAATATQANAAVSRREQRVLVDA
jgi:hypothetical protein